MPDKQDEQAIANMPQGWRAARLLEDTIITSGLTHQATARVVLERIPKPTAEITLPTRDSRQILMTICPDFGPRYLYLDPATRGIPGIVHHSEQIGNFNVVFDYDSEGKLAGIELY